MKRYAFTYIELITIIIVGGILVAVIIPRFETDNLATAVNHVVRHIRYTQHLAMVDDMYDADEPLWYKAMWRISFRSQNCYVVSSNTDLDMNYDRHESATDPLTKLLLYSNISCTQDITDNSDVFLQDKYGIDDIVFSNACGANRFIAFDYLGRPHKTLSSVDDLLTEECKITLYSNARRGVISILAETGYVTSVVEEP